MLSDPVTLMSGRTVIEPRCAGPFDAGGVWGPAVLPKVLDDSAGAVALFGVQCHRLAEVAALSCNRLLRCDCVVLSGVGDGQVGTKAVSVFHQGMAAVGQLRGLAVALTHKPRSRNGADLMRLVRAALALEASRTHAASYSQCLAGGRDSRRRSQQCGSSQSSRSRGKSTPG